MREQGGRRTRLSMRSEVILLCRMMNLWVALAEGAAVASYNPASGKQLAKVRSCSHIVTVSGLPEAIAQDCCW